METFGDVVMEFIECFFIEFFILNKSNFFEIYLDKRDIYWERMNYLVVLLNKEFN